MSGRQPRGHQSDKKGGKEAKAKTLDDQQGRTPARLTDQDWKMCKSPSV